MSRPIVASLVAALAGGGCQTFIGVDDVNAHLPRLDGSYLMTIHRVRTSPDHTDDRIRLHALASMDPESRTLDVSFVILGFGGDNAVAEGSLSGLEFPADSASLTFAFNLQIPTAAVAAPPPEGADAAIDVPQMLLRAESDYSFCARPADSQQAMPTFGTLLVTTGAPLADRDHADVDCDEP